MAKYNLFLVLILTATLIKVAKPDGLQNFVWAKMADYSAWLKTNYLDPSPFVQGPDRLQPYGAVGLVDVFLKNHVVQGHSNGISITHVRGNLSLGYFQVGLNITEKVTFWGEHSANGTILNAIPVNVEGGWAIITDYLRLKDIIIYVEELPTGYLNITNYRYFDFSIDVPYASDIQFDNLSHGSGDCAESLQWTLWHRFYHQYLTYSLLANTHPLISLYFRYWEDILNATPLEEIISTPPPTSRHN